MSLNILRRKGLFGIGSWTKKYINKRICQNDNLIKDEKEAMGTKEKALSDLYILAEHWQSDLKFFEDELRFLKELIGKYFISLIEVEHIDHTKQLVDDLLGMEKKRKRLEKDIGEHLHQLTKLVESQFLQDTQGYKERHSKMETEMFEFLKDFRRVKNELFHVTEQIMKSEKAKHLLGT